MTGNKVMKLWSAIITAFFAVLAALGFATPATASTAVQQVEENLNSSADVTASRPAPVSFGSPYDHSRPPTMKQRIVAEAHGSSPRCRRLPRSAADTFCGAAAERDTGPAAAPAFGRPQRVASTNGPAAVDRSTQVNGPAPADHTVSANRPARLDRPAAPDRPAPVDAPVSADRPTSSDRPVTLDRPVSLDSARQARAAASGRAPGAAVPAHALSHAGPVRTAA